MSVTTTVVYDDAQVTVYREYDDVALCETIHSVYKPGSVPYNADQITTKLRQAVQTFGSNYANWATLTNVQKDTANRQAQRALANLCRMVLDDLTDAGV